MNGILAQLSSANQGVEVAKSKSANSTHSWKRSRLLLLCGGAVIVGCLSLLPWSRKESQAADWRHHQQAERRWEEYQQQGSSANSSSDSAGKPEVVPAIKWVLPNGAAMFMDGLLIAGTDIDIEVTRSILSHLPYDTQGANQVWRDSQQILTDAESVLQNTDLLDKEIAQPSLEYEQVRFLSAGTGRMVRLRIFETCCEDGDVVEVGLNGIPVVTVVLTKEGADVCLPVNMLSQGSNALQIRPVWEGSAPGITMGIETSQGVGYLRPLSQDDLPLSLNMNNPVLFLPQLE